MCDYSLHLVDSRPAKVGDKLVTTDFTDSLTRGFTEAGGDPDVAVCLLPGIQLSFELPVRYYHALSPFGAARAKHAVAKFVQVNMDDPHKHHDALEFPDGRIVLVTRLVPGQTAKVLQLPVGEKVWKPIKGSTETTARSAATPDSMMRPIDMAETRAEGRVPRHDRVHA